MSNRKRHQMQRRKSDIELLQHGADAICHADNHQLESVGEITFMLLDGMLHVECFECPLCGRGYVIPLDGLQVEVRPEF